MSSTRDDAHRLVDAVPDDEVATVVEWLRQVTGAARAGRPRRKFQSLGAGEADPHLATRSAEILRGEFGREQEARVIVVDTGPVVAMVNRRDQRHAECAQLLTSFRGPLLLPVVLLTEIGHSAKVHL